MTSSLVSRCLGLWIGLALTGSTSFDPMPRLSEGIERTAVQAALTRSLDFLQRDGRAWYDGTLPVQNKRACVSCHQVPSGVWSVGAAHRALGNELPDEYTRWVQDTRNFISDPAIGRGAMWSQLLISDERTRGPEGEEDPWFEKWWPAIRDNQEESGAWAAGGQFPSQQRSIEESDAVVTMWMIRALRDRGRDSPEVSDRLQRAREFVASTEGDSTEWIVWQLLLEEPGSEAAAGLVERLRSAQNEDGSWGWKPGEAGIPYATGAALYALTRAEPASRMALDRAVQFLVERQQEDGSWLNPASRVSNSKSKKMDYIYQYWGTAWATLGLAEYYETLRPEN